MFIEENEKLPTNDTYVEDCGVKYDKCVCENCGSEMNKTHKFCINCGCENKGSVSKTEEPKDFEIEHKIEGLQNSIARFYQGGSILTFVYKYASMIALGLSIIMMATRIPNLGDIANLIAEIDSILLLFYGLSVVALFAQKKNLALVIVFLLREIEAFSLLLNSEHIFSDAFSFIVYGTFIGVFLMLSTKKDSLLQRFFEEL